MRNVDQLAMAARDGDRAALEDFVARTQADVWRFCAQMMGADQADDITQETFLRAIGTLHRFRGESSARTWLMVIARNTCVDTIRRSQRRRNLVDRLSRRAESHQTTVSAGHTVELDELIGALNPDRRMAFELTQVLGMSYDEAAEVCGVPIGTIRSRVSRARIDLLGAFDEGDATGTASGSW